METEKGRTPGRSSSPAGSTMDTPGLGLLYQTGGGRGAENNTAKHTAMIKRLVKSDCVFVSCQSVCVSELED